MNIEALEKAAENYHKGTMAIVEKLIGLPAQKIKTTPIIVRKGSEILGFISGDSNVSINTDFVQPFIMNGAFSLEVKMKLLSMLETKNQLKGHSLLTLYGELSHDTKRHTREKLKDIVSKSDWHRKISNEINSNYKIQFSWDAHKLISNSALAFERWRYSFEDKDKVTWFAGYIELQQALNSRLAIIKSPEFK